MFKFIRAHQMKSVYDVSGRDPHDSGLWHRTCDALTKKRNQSCRRKCSTSGATTCSVRTHVVILKRVNSLQRVCRQCTIPLKTNSNYFGGFWNEEADSNSNFVVAKIIYFERFEFLGVFKVQSHTMWPSMCLCCGLFAPTQFQLECCGVFDDSR